MRLISTELPLIMVKDIEYTYPNGTTALKEINLNIYQGELVGIMGKNGAGKTTLIRTLNGLIRPTQGDIYIDNNNISNETIASLSKKVGLIFQNASHQLFANTIEDEIKFSLKSFNLSKEENQKKTHEILHQFNLIQIF
ncbi:MAG: energy-coupling factor ABC transporter ATP-binding protein [Promethearchaeota archaeon]